MHIVIRVYISLLFACHNFAYNFISHCEEKQSLNVSTDNKMRNVWDTIKTDPNPSVLTLLAEPHYAKQIFFLVLTLKFSYKDGLKL